MTQEMTGWFSGLVRPTRKGVYQTKANDIPGYLWFNYWNGRRWSSGGYARVEDAHKFRHERQNDDVDYWRGLARPNLNFMTHDNTAENIEGEANARRIVACVNACKGIKTESLEMEVLSWITDETGENPLQRERDELLEARRACGERLIEVEQQRDELRATLVRIATAKPANPLQFQHWAQKAAMQAFEKVDDGDPALGEAVEQWKRENL